MSIKRLAKSLILCSAFCLMANHALAEEIFTYPKTPEESQKLIKELIPEAEKNNTKAQYELGLIYGKCVSHGYNVCKQKTHPKACDDEDFSSFDYSNCDRKKSAYWLSKSANANYAPAEFLMGNIYSFGSYEAGIKQNYLKAKDWYLKSLRDEKNDKNNSLIYYHIKLLYQEGGYGLQKDPKKAAYWCKKTKIKGFQC
ncbi:sel1 repeat family protein [Acetobacteraceae bacterium]|nr:sel1 repeat family protein [Acetobacteraceae bacterium]